VTNNSAPSYIHTGQKCVEINPAFSKGYGRAGAGPPPPSQPAPAGVGPARDSGRQGWRRVSAPCIILERAAERGRCAAPARPVWRPRAARAG
jgi:hypothetical protein